MRINYLNCWNLIFVKCYQHFSLLLSSFHITVATAETQYPLPHYVHNHHHYLVDTDEYQWVQFFPSGVVQWHSFICTSMSDAILSDCPSAAICHTATTCNGILAGMFNLYCHTTNIHLWLCGRLHKIEGITFRAALVPYFLCIVHSIDTLSINYYSSLHSIFIYMFWFTQITVTKIPSS